MLCQHCNKNEAEYHFSITNGFQAGEVHLCKECAELLGNQYMEYYRKMAPFGWQMTNQGAFSEKPTLGFSGTQPDITQLDEDFAYRRKLSELRSRLQYAVDKEDYETAAKLRDEIQGEKKMAETRSKRIRDVSIN